VHLGVGRIGELVQQDSAGGLGRDALGLGDRLAHQDAGREHHLGAEVAQQRHAFSGHRFRHGQDQPVAADSGREG